MKRNSNLLIALTAFSFGTLIIACMRDNLPLLKEESPMKTETFEMTGGNGDYYSITLDHFAEKVVYRKKRITPHNPSAIKKGLYLAVSEKCSAVLGKLVFEKEKKYWYIPISGGAPFNLFDPAGGEAIGGGGGDYICFCEDSGEEPEPGICDYVQHGNWRTCLMRSCYDCDMMWCPPGMPSGTSVAGTIIEAEAVVVIEEDSRAGERNIGIYRGGRVEIEVQIENDLTTITRNLLPQNVEYPRNIFNLTNLSPSGNTLPLEDGVQYWFVPFDLNADAISIQGGGGDTPTCHSDSDKPCQGECSLELKNGCYECECSSSGDCDMKPGAASTISMSSTGGVFIKSQYLIVN